MVVLAGLGVGALSMSPPLIPAAKATLRGLSLAEARELAAQVLDLETPQAVREHVAGWVAQRGP
jgi:multiphosphoryl transfer protein